ncbi:MAG: hypothetical protein DRJ05_19805 [Bacteroidetes bacterium]|nr:MAG: hypothetical protein DRJ05_19805 [Bacteroidota bacterium]
MGFVTKIKRAWGQMVLHARVKKLKRNKKLVNLNKAETIGIIYELTDQARFKKIKTLKKELTTPTRQIVVVGFVNKDDIPNYCIEANSGYYFNKKDLNWFGFPKNDYIAKFINKEFDIFIDLSLEGLYPLRSISSLSRSKFKVGRYAKNNKEPFDLMIKLKKGNPSIEELSEQIVHYLLILNSK